MISNITYNNYAYYYCDKAQTARNRIKNKKYHAILTVQILMKNIVGIKWNAKKYHTVGTIPKSNFKIVERGQLDTPNTQIHDL